MPRLTRSPRGTRPRSDGTGLGVPALAHSLPAPAERAALARTGVPLHRAALGADCHRAVTGLRALPAVAAPSRAGSARSALRIARRQGAGTVCMTDRTPRDGTDPWAGLPAYWDRAVRTVGPAVVDGPPPTM